ncbi:MAG TPA: hypothetical protein VL334_16745 [Anaerolineae bacterium]|nr:hypothetical protein [Anaerolineae bacterium]
MTLNLLVYYNAETAEAATGGIDALGNHRFLQRYTDFARGWTHIAATKDRLFYYNATTTEAATAQIDAAGNHRFLQRFPADPANSWTHIAATEDHLLFYNTMTGAAATAAIDAAGNWIPLQRYDDFAEGWTAIAATQNRLLYHNAATASLATAEIDAAGNHRFINFLQPESTDFWTTLISAQNTFLFYNADSGGGATAQIDASGAFVPLQTLSGLSPGWAQIAGTQRHVLFYNPNASYAVTGEFSDDGSYRDLFGYADFSTGWTHVSALKVATLAEQPEVPVLDPVVTLLRPDDLLNLAVECRNLQLDRSDRANLVLVPTDATQPAYLIVHFPPQTIAEEAIYEPTPPPAQPPPDEQAKPYNNTPPGFPASRMPAQARARIGQPSRLVFQLPANSHPRIPYTIEGLLNWTGLPLNVAPVAAMPEEPTPEQLAAAPSIAPPAELETAIEMPYRLILSPGREGSWTHELAPKTRAGRTELWHTRLVKRDGERIVALSKANPAPLRAIWSPDYVADSSQPGDVWPALGEPDEWSNTAVLTAMNRRDRHELVILTSAFTTAETRGFVTGPSPWYPNFKPTPIQAEQVMLSSLGGWLKSRGNWDPPIEWLPALLGELIPLSVPINLNPNRLEDLRLLLDPGLRDQILARPPLPDYAYRVRRRGRPGAALNISEWVHVATQGRDHYVRIVYEGFLYPFGHRAALIKVTERKFNNVDGAPVAYLAQRMFIVVREPAKDYSHEPLQSKGLGMPLKQVRLTTLVTPDIDLPVKIAGDYSFWIMVGGQAFRFHAVGQDSAGHAIDFTAALVFVPRSDAYQPGVPENVRAIAMKPEYSAFRDCQVPGQAVTYAERDGSASDNTTLTTRSLFFNTHPAPVDKGGFLPILDKAAVNLTAVEQILGTTTPVEIKYFAPYLANGFDGANEVFAELITKVGSDFSADKAGGIATPNLSITSITRKLGAIAGTPAKAASAAPFDPRDFFGDVADKALLFGKLKLSDLLDDKGTFANAPKIQPLPFATPPAVELTWEPQVKPTYSLGFLKFVSDDPDRRLIVHARIERPAGTDPGRSEFSGRLNSFHLEFLNVLALNFVSFSFRSETRKKPDVSVQLNPGNPLRFMGDLEFVEDLKDIIPPALFGKGPSLDVTAEGLRVGFAIGLPPIAIGVFALKDVSLSAALALPFVDGNPVFDFGISERQRPFNLTIAFFGGGGFFHLQLDTKQGLRVVEAALEFGASAAINLGVASGGVHIMAGIYFKLERKDGSDYATLSGYFRLGGELSILGLISVSLEFLLSFTYETKTGKASGRATLTVKVEILFFSKSIAITVEKKFGGKNADPKFVDTWDAPALWDEYAGAFA